MMNIVKNFNDTKYESINKNETWPAEKYVDSIQDVLDTGDSCLTILFTANLITYRGEVVSGNAVNEGVITKKNVVILSTAPIDDRGKDGQESWLGNGSSLALPLLSTSMMPAIDMMKVIDLTHELGHTFSAPHDMDSVTCMPKRNGSYLMAFRIIENGPNNYVSFSGERLVKF